MAEDSEAAFRDVSRLVRQFARQQSSSFAAFRSVWLALNFSNIHYARPAGEDPRRFVTRLLAFALSHVCNGHSYLVRLGGLYALYALHGTQYCERPRARCRVAPAQWNALCALLREVRERVDGACTTGGAAGGAEDAAGGRARSGDGADVARIFDALCARDGGAMRLVHAYSTHETELAAVRYTDAPAQRRAGGADCSGAAMATLGAREGDTIERTANLPALERLASAYAASRAATATAAGARAPPPNSVPRVTGTPPTPAPAATAVPALVAAMRAALEAYRVAPPPPPAQPDGDGAPGARSARAHKRRAPPEAAAPAPEPAAAPMLPAAARRERERLAATAAALAPVDEAAAVDAAVGAARGARAQARKRAGARGGAAARRPAGEAARVTGEQEDGLDENGCIGGHALTEMNRPRRAPGRAADGGSLGIGSGAGCGADVAAAAAAAAADAAAGADGARALDDPVAGELAPPSVGMPLSFGSLAAAWDQAHAPHRADALVHAHAAGALPLVADGADPFAWPADAEATRRAARAQGLGTDAQGLLLGAPVPLPLHLGSAQPSSGRAAARGRAPARPRARGGGRGAARRAEADGGAAGRGGRPAARTASEAHGAARARATLVVPPPPLVPGGPLAAPLLVHAHGASCSDVYTGDTGGAGGASPAVRALVPSRRSELLRGVGGLGACAPARGAACDGLSARAAGGDLVAAGGDVERAARAAAVRAVGAPDGAASVAPLVLAAAPLAVAAHAPSTPSVANMDDARAPAAGDDVNAAADDEEEVPDEIDDW
ncbi:hypothetical protein KFE25_004847 [Diacronema lutheri]|uniref:Uncharacterized protein n=1 Tax=Diacronema lutheri TaxID=2081491 RepID=A0A8J5XD28_DIALT|nr:hypothetical protein KFE25_004847 [Diacronema lutheri]